MWEGEQPVVNVSLHYSGSVSSAAVSLICFDLSWESWEQEKELKCYQSLLSLHFSARQARGAAGRGRARSRGWAGGGAGRESKTKGEK